MPLLRRRTDKQWSLRRRLVIGLTALLVGAILIIGVVTPLILRGFLTQQVDQQLNSAAGRSARGTDRSATQTAPENERGLGFLLQPGQAVGTVGALIRDGQIINAKVLDNSGEPKDIGSAQIAQLARVPANGRILSVNLGPLGRYRVTAQSYGVDTRVTGIPLRGSEATVRRLILVELVVAGGVLILSALVSTAIIGWSMRPLRRVAATAKRVSELPLDKGEVQIIERVKARDADPSTEVGQVGAAVNQMLSHVSHALDARQQSETRVRSFVADASHELRTPLAAIRGYAELTRRSTEHIPPDVQHALGRVESESARMTILVEDLLLLARLDSGRPLELTLVDLSMLIVNAVSDAHTIAPEYVFQLELPDEPVEVDADQARLHQVIANLLANSRTHTPPGTVVTTSLQQRADGSVVVTVADNGPGIAPDLLPNIFERFARGDTSRSRQHGSTGLGLAIVMAVVKAHRGQVAVISEPGDTQFIVTLPPATALFERS
ncbi:MAG: ATP-binding protein [Antricoccus sp.]